MEAHALVRLGQEYCRILEASVAYTMRCCLKRKIREKRGKEEGKRQKISRKREEGQMKTEFFMLPNSVVLLNWNIMMLPHGVCPQAPPTPISMLVFEESTFCYTSSVHCHLQGDSWVLSLSR